MSYLAATVEATPVINDVKDEADHGLTEFWRRHLSGPLAAENFLNDGLDEQSTNQVVQETNYELRLWRFEKISSFKTRIYPVNVFG